MIVDGSRIVVYSIVVAAPAPRREIVRVIVTTLLIDVVLLEAIDWVPTTIAWRHKNNSSEQRRQSVTVSPMS